MRLIDADSLLQSGVIVVDLDNPMKSINEVLNRICNAPTAYDVKKVEQKLKRCAEEYQYCEGPYGSGKAFAYKNAINFLKEGFIDG